MPLYVGAKQSYVDKVGFLGENSEWKKNMLGFGLRFLKMFVQFGHVLHNNGNSNSSRRKTLKGGKFLWQIECGKSTNENIIKYSS